MNNTNGTLFSDWLQSEMDKHGWSQADLARRTGLSRSAISLLVRGHSKPKAETCIALARAFDVPAELVLRVADVLPERPRPDDPTIQEILDVVRNLTPEERQEILEYALWRYRRRQE